MTPIERITNITKSFDDIENRWNYLYDEYHKNDLQICDLLHEIEDADFNACQGYKLAKQLQGLRQTRRLIKNEQAQLKPLYDYYLQNKKLLIDFHKIQSTITKEKELQDNWYYNKRTETEMIS